MRRCISCSSELALACQSSERKPRRGDYVYIDTKPITYYDADFDKEGFFSKEEMNGARSLYSRKQVDAAGSMFIHSSPASEMFGNALNVINNWRSYHGIPLKEMRFRLRQTAQEIDAQAVVSQRTKRLPSIATKLCRFPRMKLCQMQDIGGCRAVVENIQVVKDLLQDHKRKQSKHELIRIDDYIGNPKVSGYRGIHLVYRYNSTRYVEYNKLKIEIQLRTKLQHAWSTAVETVGTFLGQALKSSQGESTWLKFFALMGAAIALQEGCTPVPETPHDKNELIKQLRDYKDFLHVNSVLDVVGVAINKTKLGASLGMQYYLLHLDSTKKEVKLIGFQKNDLGKAHEEYLALEQRFATLPGSAVVLVSVDSLQALEAAYPNYFLDAKLFIEAVDEAVAGL